MQSSVYKSLVVLTYTHAGLSTLGDAASGGRGITETDRSASDAGTLLTYLEMWLMISTLALLSLCGAEEWVPFFVEFKLFFTVFITVSPGYTKREVFRRFYRPVFDPIISLIYS